MLYWLQRHTDAMGHSQTKIDLTRQDLEGSADGLQRRLEPADVAQIRLLVRIPPAQRVRAMLEMQEIMLKSWHASAQSTP